MNSHIPVTWYIIQRMRNPKTTWSVGVQPKMPTYHTQVSPKLQNHSTWNFTAIFGQRKSCPMMQKCGTNLLYVHGLLRQKEHVFAKKFLQMRRKCTRMHNFRQFFYFLFLGGAQPPSQTPIPSWPYPEIPNPPSRSRNDSHMVTRDHKRLAVWLSGNALASINVVALRQTRLVLGWVTVCGRVNHFGM